VREISVLDRLPDHGDARGAQKLLELGQVVALREGGDAEGALLGASPLLRAGSGTGWAGAAVTTTLHVPLESRVLGTARKGDTVAARRPADGPRQHAGDQPGAVMTSATVAVEQR
jgi:hypothetical protein